MYLLDTNHCSRLILGDANLILRLSEIPRDRIYTCAIVAGELINMAEQSQQRTQNILLIKNFLKHLEIKTSVESLQFKILDSAKTIFGLQLQQFNII
jgi:predicted nucleic acid-binding protein